MTEPLPKTPPGERATLLATVLFSGVAALILLVAPVVVGQLIAEYGFSLEQAGYIIAVELAGSLASVPALWWMGRVNWRRAACVAIAAMVVTNLASVWVVSFESLLWMRLAAALSAGSLMVVCLAAIGMTTQQDRNFGFWVVGQLMLGAVGLVALPLLFQHTGLWIFYAGVAVAILALAPLVRYLPAGARQDSPTGAGTAARWSVVDAITHAPLALLGILGIFIFYLVISGVWTYVERMGVAAGITGPVIAIILSVATVMGIVGAGLASASAGRFARHHMIWLGFGLLLLSVLLLWQSPALARFVTAVLIFKFTWTFVLPFMLATITASDPSGKLIVLTNLVMGGGLAVGPALAARLLGAGQGYDVLLLALAGVAVLSGAIMAYTSARPIAAT